MKEIYKIRILQEIIPVLNDVNKKISVWPYLKTLHYLDRIFIEFSKKQQSLTASYSDTV